MDLELILNELSFHTVANNVHLARERMNRLVYTLKQCVLSGFPRILRTKEDLNMTGLAPDYNVAQWRNDPLVDRETRRYFGTLATKTPVLTNDYNKDAMEALSISEFRINGEVAEGLGVALLLDTLAVSVASDAKWETHQINIEVLVLNQEGKIEERQEPVRHASRPDHVVLHQAWITRHQQQYIKNGTDIWGRRNELFPHLIFCPEVENQINPIGRGNPVLRGVVDTLFKLESYFSGWDHGHFDPTLLGRRTTQESEATLAKYPNERTFLCPDGGRRLFSWHARLTPGEWRLYFMPEERSRKCLIGYVGPHLPTVLFN